MTQKELSNGSNQALVLAGIALVITVVAIGSLGTLPEAESSPSESNTPAVDTIEIAKSDELTKFKDNELGFEITYPNTWEKNPLAMKAEFAIKKKDELKLGLLRIDVANIKMDRDELWAEITKPGAPMLMPGLREIHPSAKLIRSESTILGGRQAHEIVYSYRMQNLDLDVEIVAHQIHCFRGSLYYLLNFESPRYAYVENLGAVKSILYTFTFR